MVTTNGIYMVYCNSDIPAGYENKIVDKNGVFIDARFPNWTKPIPADSDIKETNAGKFAAAIHNTDINMNMTEAAAFKSDSHYKIGEFVFAAYYIKIIEKFIKTQKDIKVYIRKEDRLSFEGKVFQYKNECAVKIVGDNATMVIMPCKVDAAKNAIDIGVFMNNLNSIILEGETINDSSYGFIENDKITECDFILKCKRMEYNAAAGERVEVVFNIPCRAFGNVASNVDKMLNKNDVQGIRVVGLLKEADGKLWVTCEHIEYRFSKTKK